MFGIPMQASHDILTNFPSRKATSPIKGAYLEYLCHSNPNRPSKYNVHKALKKKEKKRRNFATMVVASELLTLYSKPRY